MINKNNRKTKIKFLLKLYIIFFIKEYIVVIGDLSEYRIHDK